MAFIATIGPAFFVRGTVCAVYFSISLCSVSLWAVHSNPVDALDTDATKSANDPMSTSSSTERAANVKRRFIVPFLLALFCIVSPRAVGSDDLVGAFGRETHRSPEGRLTEKWRNLQAAIREEGELLDACKTEARNCDSPAALRFLVIVEEAEKQTGRNRLDTVNRAVNGAIRFKEDQVLFGEADHWAPPLAALSLGFGDCEEFAIAKYVALLRAGTKQENVQIVLGFDRSVRRHHMILAARDDARWLILENRRNALVEDSEYLHFDPLFVFDHTGLRQFGKPAPADGFRLRDMVGTPEDAGPDVCLA